MHTKDVYVILVKGGNCMNDRHAQILDVVNEYKKVEVNRLAEMLDVSQVTIRKDLSFLESKSLLYRTHGGARKQSSFAFEKNISEKEIFGEFFNSSNIHCCLVFGLFILIPNIREKVHCTVN